MITYKNLTAGGLFMILEAINRFRPKGTGVDTEMFLAAEIRSAMKKLFGGKWPEDIDTETSVSPLELSEAGSDFMERVFKEAKEKGEVFTARSAEHIVNATLSIKEKERK